MRGKTSIKIKLNDLSIVSESRSVVSDSLRPRGLQPARLPCPWASPGQKTGVGSLSLLQGIFPSQGRNPGLQRRRQILYGLSSQGSSVHRVRNDPAEARRPAGGAGPESGAEPNQNQGPPLPPPPRTRPVSSLLLLPSQLPFPSVKVSCPRADFLLIR